LQGKYEEARKGFTESLAIERSLGSQRGIAVTALYLAVTECLGSPKRTLKKVKDCIDTLQGIGDPYPVARGHNLLAECLLERGKLDDAEAELKCSLDVAKKGNLKGLDADANALLAVVNEKKGDLAGAKKYAQRAKEFFESQNVKHPLEEDLARILTRKKQKAPVLLPD
jgi:tetratricopeptide (TPR) repeat protein